MRDMSEREKVIAIEVEKKKSEALLKNVLPHHICERLKAEEFHESVQIADTCDDVSILFADIVGFTQFASKRTPLQVVHYLNKVFRIFDVLVDKYGLEKVSNIELSFMIVIIVCCGDVIS
jgi:adenylate cyclase